ncbi:MAG: hypothetical protein KGL25_08575 [Gammaproteobacteria bacterium]|nr:hypothetical protein [Gammaproteobacteria bacterium]
MPSSTSSSRRLTAADRPGVAQPVPVRDIPAQRWGAILLGALVLAALLIGGWEWHWRKFGALPGNRDDAMLWARQRLRIGQGAGDATVLVGASRTFFDVQLPVWEELSGRRPIQLALNGTSPTTPLEDLADDQNFRGRVLVGVAPDLFFSGFEFMGANFRNCRKHSPSDWVGKWLSMHLVEPYFAFYDPDFALFTVIRRQDWPLRAGMRGGTRVRKLTQVGPDRNNYMWTKLVTDPDYRALARRIWAEDFHDPPPTAAELVDKEKTLYLQIARNAAAVARLRARGVTVVYVREPSTGEYLQYETGAFPRQAAWDPLIAHVRVPGIYYDDYPQLRAENYQLPEWSHMSRESAERYTRELYLILQGQFPPDDGSRW